MLLQKLIELARWAPDKAALVVNGKTITYAEFAARILDLRARWTAHDLPPGSLAVIPTAGPLANWCAVLALRSLGLTTVCAPRLELLAKLELRNVACLVLREGSDATLTPWPQARRLELADATPASTVAPAGPAPGQPFHPGAHILLSSGTTGIPKKLVLDGTLDAERAIRSGQLFGDDAGTVLHTADFGLWTGIGYKWPQRVWQHGGTVVIDQRTDWPRHFFDHGPTDAALTPPLAAQLLAGLREAPALARPRHRPTLYLGGAMPAAALVRGLQQHTHSRLVHFFGATELLPYPMGCPVDNPGSMDWLQVQPGRQVEVVTEEGAPCPDGVHGQLRIRLDPLDCHAYLDDPVTTARVFRDGWFYPGDLAERRADGRVRILGRAVDVINVNGRKLPSGPLEEKVREVLGVATVCAFSGPDVRGENALLIAIETSHRIPGERLAPLAHSLRDFGRLQFAQVPQFPRTRNGTRKVDRLALRQLLYAEMARGASRQDGRA